jgi:hypothetical protein
MIQRTAAGLALLLLLSLTVSSQSNNTRLGDNYARAARRAMIYAGDGNVGVEQMAMAIDEADVEASTPAEEASLREISRIVRVWKGKVISSEDRACYLVLKANLNARSGATPEQCR